MEIWLATSCTRAQHPRDDGPSNFLVHHFACTITQRAVKQSSDLLRHWYEATYWQQFRCSSTNKRSNMKQSSNCREELVHISFYCNLTLRHCVVLVRKSINRIQKITAPQLRIHCMLACVHFLAEKRSIWDAEND